MAIIRVGVYLYNNEYTCCLTLGYIVISHPLYPIKNAWRPFELGSTKCIGQELALLELKLALVFTVRELDFDFNYDLWEGIKTEEKTAGAVPDTVNGERTYRCGDGIGSVKDDLPMRVRLR
ncbi:hypothetical protein TEQG_07983 [Trichophyton equinum CBS 127.97]|uniref:Cytochrome P450 n=1 Tax=Trichophyton equinum (strain ATCC MYA-4606 / CBS 127.97) TaxID=559882 RepID=F2Q4C0_TRIEC|nr:hypothetical protein TEQG_07983 [Trichophyton equinum CBS 127.97]